jgi:hypothetical protein
MVPRRTLRPHGNHNPQHGGQFFMAPDNTPHLEGTLPAPRLFRLYLYDDYARPLPAPRVNGVKGRVEVGTTVVPLVAASSGSYLQGRLAAGAQPIHVTAKVRLKPDAPEYRFDFTFAGVTRDPASRPPAASTRISAQAPAAIDPAAVDPALIQVPIPSSVAGIIAQLRVRDTQVRELLDRGNLPAVFVPAFQARDLALALESRIPEIAAGRRDGAESSIRDLVRSAWLLDAFGDVGNAEQARAAYGPFHDAATRIASAFASR